MANVGDRIVEIPTGESFADWAMLTLNKTLQLKVFINYPDLFDSEKHGPLTWVDIMDIPMKEGDRFALEARWNKVATKFAARKPEMIPKEFTEACNPFRVNKLETLLSPVTNVLGYTSFDSENKFSEIAKDMVGADMYNLYIYEGAHSMGDERTDIYKEALRKNIDPKLLTRIRDRLFVLNSVLAVRRMAGKEGGPERIKKVKIGEVKMAFAFGEMVKTIVESVDRGDQVTMDMIEPYLEPILGKYYSGMEAIDDAKLKHFLGDERYRRHKELEYACENWGPTDPF